MDRIAALGVATDHDQIGLKPDQREIDSPQITHLVKVVEEQCGDSSPALRTRCVRIPDPSKPETCGGEDVARTLNLKSGSRPDSLNNIQESKLPNLETARPLNLTSGRVLDLFPPAHPTIRDLSLIRQESGETVHHYWARFLLVMNRIKDCREREAISLFLNKCTDIGILNAISRRKITRFADLTSIVRKYCAIESVWKTKDKFWDNPAPNITRVRNKRAHYRQASEPNIKKQKPSTGTGPYWKDGSMDPVEFIIQGKPHQRTASEHVGYYGR